MNQIKSVSYWISFWPSLFSFGRYNQRFQEKTSSDVKNWLKMIKRKKNQYIHLSHPLMSIKQFNGNPFSLQSIQHRATISLFNKVNHVLALLFSPHIHFETVPIPWQMWRLFHFWQALKHMKKNYRHIIANVTWN